MGQLHALGPELFQLLCDAPSSAPQVNGQSPVPEGWRSSALGTRLRCDDARGPPGSSPGLAEAAAGLRATVCPMLFHREVSDDFLRRVFDTMARAEQHTFQVLTKRAHRMAHKIETLGSAYATAYLARRFG